MVEVTIWGSLRRYTDGRATVSVKGSTTKAVLDALAKNHPGLAPIIDQGVSLAIDGEVFKDAWFTPIKPDSEVVLMPLMVGG
ncbi:MAG: MoaD/ThiS family protein [Rhodobacteraceae bacterium]|nr:MoaD/ThiS family protein [Paracoccaceae bacterium]